MKAHSPDIKRDDRKALRYVRLSNLLLICIVVAGYGLYVTDSAPNYLISSVILLLLLVFAVRKYQPVSVPSIILLSCYLPALSFLWAWILGAPYVSWNNQWLQDDARLKGLAILLSLTSVSTALLVISILNSATHGDDVRMRQKCDVVLDGFSYFLVCIATAFFFWLTEPSFGTIVSNTYAQIIDARIDRTQYAGGLAVIFWLIGFLTYVAHSQGMAGRGNIGRKPIDRMFIAVSILGAAWLALHARRSELIGMGAVTLLFLSAAKPQIRILSVALLFGAFLALIGEVRATSLERYIAYGHFTPLARTGIKVVAIPGGASNVYMTFLDTLHFFQTHKFFGGSTFLNYFAQLLPANLAQDMGVEVPPYYYEQVLRNYQYNGGTYIGAVFFGNFGPFGSILLGIFVALYVTGIRRALDSSRFSIKLIGLYLIAFAFRGFWFEMITIIKPIVVILFPLHVFMSVARPKGIRFSRPNL